MESVTSAMHCRWPLSSAIINSCQSFMTNYGRTHADSQPRGLLMDSCSTHIALTWHDSVCTSRETAGIISVFMTCTKTETADVSLWLFIIIGLRHNVGCKNTAMFLFVPVVIKIACFCLLDICLNTKSKQNSNALLSDPETRSSFLFTRCRPTQSRCNETRAGTVVHAHRCCCRCCV